MFLIEDSKSMVKMTHSTNFQVPTHLSNKKYGSLKMQNITKATLHSKEKTKQAIFKGLLFQNDLPY